MMITLLKDNGYPVVRGVVMPNGDARIAHAILTIGATEYDVLARTVPATLAENGVTAIYWLTGPRGAQFYVQDYGPTFDYKAFSITGAPRRLRSLTRAHMDALLAMRARVTTLVDVHAGAPFYGTALVHGQRVFLPVTHADTYLRLRQADDAPMAAQIAQATERAQ